MPQEHATKKDLVFAAFQGLVTGAQPILQAANVPIAGGVLASVSQIIKLANTVKSNKEACMKTADRCLDLLSAVTDAMKSVDNETANENFKNNLDALQRTLETVQDTMQSANNRNMLSRILLNLDITAKIQSCNSDITDATNLFILRTGMEANRKLDRIIEQTAKDINAVDNGTDRFLLDREPPSTPDIFFGRKIYVEETVSSILSGRLTRIPILGLGGVGKTSVASAIIDHEDIRATFADHRYFIRCSALSSAHELILAMSLIIVGPDSLKGNSSNPLGRLLQFLKAVPKVLLVLDNLETVWNVEDQEGIKHVLSSLFKLESLVIIVTMRGSDPPGEFMWSDSRSIKVLPVLELEDAKRVFCAICRSYEDTAENDVDLSILLNQLDCVPLAVSIVARMAQVEIATPSQISASLTQYFEADRGDPNNSIKASVRLSLNSYIVKRRPECIDVLKVIAYLPGGVTSESVAEITHYSESKQLIAALLTAGLVHRENGRFNTLSPIRLFVEETYSLDQGMQQSVWEYYFQLCAEGPKCLDSLEIKSRLTSEKANCYRVLLHALKANAANRSNVPTINRFKILTRYLNSSKSNNNPHRDLKAIVDFSWFLSLTIPSSELLQLASKEFEVRCNDNFLVAEYYRILGEIFGFQSNYREAEESLAKAKLRYSAIGNRGRTADCLRRLGDIAYMEADYEEARRMLSQAKDIFNSIGNRLGEGQCLRTLGDVARMQADYEGARSTLSEAKDLFDSIGSRLGVARCLRSLGDTARGQKEYEEASNMLLEAKGIYDNIGNRLGAAQCLQNLGDIAQMQEKYEEAKRILEEAKDMFVNVGNRLGEALCVMFLGYTARGRREYEDAKRMLLEAKGMFEVIGVPNELALCKHSLDELLELMSAS